MANYINLRRRDLIIVLVCLALAAVTIRTIFNDTNARTVAVWAAILIALQLPFFWGPEVKTALVSKRAQVITGIVNSVVAVGLALLAYFNAKSRGMQCFFIFGGFIAFMFLWAIFLGTQNWAKPQKKKSSE
jgi:hypothetical protein